MTSAINPNNIDGSYPVAGQPNNTQGFRDNFTNIKTNFQYAEDEINDLQSKVLVKSALSGTTLDNNMSNGLIYNVKLQGLSYTYVQNTATSGAISIDYSAGQYQYISTTGSISLSFSNWPDSGSEGILRLTINVTNVAHTLTLPSAVSLGTSGVQGLGFGNVITFSATGTYQFDFSTVDGGTTITMFDLNRPLLGSGIASIGYGPGAGGSVTQSGSRTTGVTINKKSGYITLATAAGTSAYTSFTVTNSTVAASDTIIVNQKSGTNIYETFVTAVAAGSFRITFSAASGTSLDAPVFNFVVIKGADT